MSKLEKLQKILAEAKEEEKVYAQYLLDEYLSLTVFERKLEDYADFFGERFPLAETMGVSEEKIIELIDKALRDKEKYKSVAGRIY